MDFNLFSNSKYADNFNSEVSHANIRNIFVISLYFMNKSIFKEERTKVIIASVLGTIPFL